MRSRKLCENSRRWRDRKDGAQKGSSRPESFYQRGGSDAGRNRWKKVEGVREPDGFDELYRRWYIMSRLVGIANFIYPLPGQVARPQDSSARGSEPGWHEALGQTRDDQDRLPPVLTHGEIEGAERVSDHITNGPNRVGPTSGLYHHGRFPRSSRSFVRPWKAVDYSMDASRASWFSLCGESHATGHATAHDLDHAPALH